mmetsp:Transcript_138401/g.240854  ORF Transcript_138401/g.240854 Transcript_138401/m.240854 type:complete len:121 (-) Transcript_138401:121-483(-)
MEPCVDEAEAGNETSAKCLKFETEVRDVVAFRRLVESAWAESSNASASEVMVVLHNLVTESIAPKWNKKRRQYFCVQDVLSALPDVFIGDVGAMQWTASAAAVGVPGVGAHRLLNCSPAE